MQKPTETVTRRGQSKPPKDLARFIVNEPLPPASVVYSIGAEAREGLVAKLPPEVRAFLGALGDTARFIERYAILKDAQETLQAIASRAKATSGALSFEQHKAIRRTQRGLPLCRAPIDLVVDKDGRLGLSTSPILDSLVGIPADRIRSCTVCGRIFWAARVNSECCSERCRKTYNQRNSRAEQKRRAK